MKVVRASSFLHALLLFLLVPRPAFADRGSIPFRPNVRLYEPNQRAIIAWNGRKEILLLSTDLRASEPTKVLEVLPLPSEPKVKKGSIRSFYTATAIINRYRMRLARSRFNGRKRGMPDARLPAGRVTFFKKIGAHNISVTEVLDGGGFVTWVQKYLRSKGYPAARIPTPLIQVVNQYIQEGYKWFVFDVVDVGTQNITTDAIQYTFSTRRLYYPLKITRTETGYTRIRLMVLTPYLISKNDFVGLPFHRVRVPHQPVPISSHDLGRISVDMLKLLGRRTAYRLRIWEIYGRLDRFTHDLLCKR